VPYNEPRNEVCRPRRQVPRAHARCWHPPRRGPIMSPMPFRSTFRLPLGLAALLAAVAVPAAASAETGAPLPQGYTRDVAAVPQPSEQHPVAQAPAQQHASDEYADQDPSALTDFQEPLQPYGQWVQDPTYGTIWVPDSAQVGADFAPYQTNGHWVTDDAGE